MSHHFQLMSHRFQLRHMCDNSIKARVRQSTICQIFDLFFDLSWLGAWMHMSHLFQLRHMSDHRIAIDGCMEAHESSFSIKAHV